MDILRRLEHKYFLTEPVAAAVEAAIQAYCSPDPLGADGYTIHSLYYDTVDLAFFRANKLKQQWRHKPRVRIYDTNATGPVYLEVKSKEGDIVSKVRQRIEPARWPSVLDAPGPLHDQGFCELVRRTGAVPTLHVRYHRTAWVSDVDVYGRVTFDRRLRCALAHGDPDLRVHEQDLTFVDDPRVMFAPGSFVVLELKCEQLIPRWMVNLVRRFELVQLGFSKYGAGIERMGLDPEPLDAGPEGQRSRYSR